MTADPAAKTADLAVEPPVGMRQADQADDTHRRLRGDRRRDQRRDDGGSGQPGDFEPGPAQRQGRACSTPGHTGHRRVTQANRTARTRAPWGHVKATLTSAHLVMGEEGHEAGDAQPHRHDQRRSESGDGHVAPAGPQCRDDDRQPEQRSRPASTAAAVASTLTTPDVVGRPRATPCSPGRGGSSTALEKPAAARRLAHHAASTVIVVVCSRDRRCSTAVPPKTGATQARPTPRSEIDGVAPARRCRRRVTPARRRSGGGNRGDRRRTKARCRRARAVMTRPAGPGSCWARRRRPRPAKRCMPASWLPSTSTPRAVNRYGRRRVSSLSSGLDQAPGLEAGDGPVQSARAEPHAGGLLHVLDHGVAVPGPLGQAPHDEQPGIGPFRVVGDSGHGLSLVTGQLVRKTIYHTNPTWPVSGRADGPLSDGPSASGVRLRGVCVATIGGIRSAPPRRRRVLRTRGSRRLVLAGSPASSPWHRPRRRRPIPSERLADRPRLRPRAAAWGSGERSATRCRASPTTQILSTYYGTLERRRVTTGRAAAQRVDRRHHRSPWRSPPTPATTSSSPRTRHSPSTARPVAAGSGARFQPDQVPGTIWERRHSARSAGARARGLPWPPASPIPTASPGSRAVPVRRQPRQRGLQLCQLPHNITVRGTLQGTVNSTGAARTVNVLPLGQYVADVTPSESPASWGALGGGEGAPGARGPSRGGPVLRDEHLREPPGLFRLRRHLRLTSARTTSASPTRTP